MAKLFEVEQKFVVDDLGALERRIEAGEWRLGPRVVQIDRYFNHPHRDFAQTDEALRIRVDGNSNRITYKGPKIDLSTKTRHEIELPIGDGDENQQRMAQVLVALGFREVASVRKTRRSVHMTHEGWSVELTLDDVEGVGTYAELELQSDAANLSRAQATLLQLGEQWQLGPVERRSYLQLLLGE